MNTAHISTGKSRPLRVLFVVTEDWYFVSHRLVIAIAAKAEGYEVSVVTRVRECDTVIRNAGVKLIPFENSRSSLNPFVDLWMLLRLIVIYRRERPDIVHHVALKPILYGTLAGILTGRPKIVNALAGMGWLSAPQSRMARYVMPIARYLLLRTLRHGVALVQNPDDESMLRKMGVIEAKIRRIPGSGVDLQKFRAHPEPHGMPVVVLPARLLWSKGVGDFVEAARLLRGRGIAAKFVLVGSPDKANPSAIPMDQIVRWIEEGVVTHLGWVTDMPKLLEASHIVCLPSFYGEGIPKSLIEAAAAARPIITTDTAGCREIVRNDGNGILVPAQNIEALAEAINRLICDKELRVKMGACGRDRAEKEFGVAAVVAQTLAIYREKLS